MNDFIIRAHYHMSFLRNAKNIRISYKKEVSDMKKTAIVMLGLMMLLICAVTVYAYEIDRNSGSVGGYSCYGSLWTISSTSMGATTHVNSSATVMANMTTIRIRHSGYDPVTETKGPYASNDVDAIASMTVTIYSATGTHYAKVSTGDEWNGDTFY